MQDQSDVVWVSVERFEGSSPREMGAWMWVSRDAVHGTVGGGRLEFDAIAHARSLLAGNTFAARTELRRYPLGPALGQCCGGVVWLKFVVTAALDAAGRDALCAQYDQGRREKDLRVAVFGGGHVGRAIVHALTPLPCRVRWIDSREEIFPSGIAAHVQTEFSDPVHAAVRELEAQSHVLIMSFSHAEDLSVAGACLERQRMQRDLPFIGLIGSKTKWASFSHRLRAKGFTQEELRQITCPIGLPSIAGKEPAVIAASVVAQLLQMRQI